MGKNDVIDVVRRYKDKVVSLMGPAEVYLYGSYIMAYYVGCRYAD